MPVNLSVLNGIHSDNIFVPGTGSRPPESMTDRLSAVESSKLDTAGAFMGGYKNKIINGSFDIWQRGTSQTTSGMASADRWYFVNVGTSTRTVTQVIATDTDRPYFNSTNILGVTLTTLDTTTSGRGIRHAQPIENLAVLAGKTVTLSFWARATMPMNIETTVQQIFGSGGSPSSPVVSNPKRYNLTSSWTKFSATFTIPAILGKTIGTNSGTDYTNVKFHIMADSVAAENEGLTGTLTPTAGTLIFFSQIQLEEGSIATPFESRHIAQELMMCQRYYENIGVGATGQWESATAWQGAGCFRVSKRTAPTMILRTTSPVIAEINVGNRTGLNSILSWSHTDPAGYYVALTGFTGATAYRLGVLSAGALAANAEL